MKKWFLLDNAGKIFPAVVSGRHTTMFRFSAKFRKLLNLTRLQTALDTVIERFPYFKVSLKSGFFWHYFIENRNRLLVQADVRYPCMNYRYTGKNAFPIRVLAFKNRLSVEFSHAITDGTGALNFLKALAAEYLKLENGSCTSCEDVIKPDTEIDEAEYEDSFKKYYDKSIPPAPRTGKAFHIESRLSEKGRYLITHGIADSEAISRLCEKHSVSMTEYLLAVLLECFLEYFYSLPEKKRKKLAKPIRLMVPVNLRKMFPSKTNLNFIVIVGPEIDPRLGSWDFREILEKVHHFMRYEVDIKFIKRQLARNVGQEKNPAIRLTPLFIKNIIAGSLYKKLGENLYTSSLSNLGYMKLPQQLEEEIESIDFIPPPSSITKTNCALLGYKDKLYINFARTIEDSTIERLFFTKLVKSGVHVKIDSNG
jgi:NRPS condensation-like uncharacterized protein